MEESNLISQSEEINDNIENDEVSNTELEDTGLNNSELNQTENKKMENSEIVNDINNDPLVNEKDNTIEALVNEQDNTIEEANSNSIESAQEKEEQNNSIENEIKNEITDQDEKTDIQDKDESYDIPIDQKEITENDRNDEDFGDFSIESENFDKSDDQTEHISSDNGQIEQISSNEVNENVNNEQDLNSTENELSIPLENLDATDEKDSLYSGRILSFPSMSENIVIPNELSENSISSRETKSIPNEIVHNEEKTSEKMDSSKEDISLDKKDALDSNLIINNDEIQNENIENSIKESQNTIIEATEPNELSEDKIQLLSNSITNDFPNEVDDEIPKIITESNILIVDPSENTQNVDSSTPIRHTKYHTRTSISSHGLPKERSLNSFDRQALRKSISKLKESKSIPEIQFLPSFKELETTKKAIFKFQVKEIILSSNVEETYFASLSRVYNVPQNFFSSDSKIPQETKSTLLYHLSQSSEVRTNAVTGNQLYFNSQDFEFDVLLMQQNGKNVVFPGAIILKLWRVNNGTSELVATGKLRLEQLEDLVHDRRMKKIQINIVEEDGKHIFATSIVDCNAPEKLLPLSFSPIKPIDREKDILSPLNSSNAIDDFQSSKNIIPPQGITYSPNQQSQNTTPRSFQNASNPSLSYSDLEKIVLSSRATIDKLLTDSSSKDIQIAKLQHELQQHIKKEEEQEEGIICLKEKLEEYQLKEMHDNISQSEAYNLLEEELSVWKKRYYQIRKEYSKLKKDFKKQEEQLSKTSSSEKGLRKYKQICITQEQVIEKLEKVIRELHLSKDKKRVYQDIKEAQAVSFEDKGVTYHSSSQNIESSNNSGRIFSPNEDQDENDEEFLKNQDEKFSTSDSGKKNILQRRPIYKSKPDIFQDRLANHEKPSQSQSNNPRYPARSSLSEIEISSPKELPSIKRNNSDSKNLYLKDSSQKPNTNPNRLPSMKIAHSNTNTENNVFEGLQTRPSYPNPINKSPRSNYSHRAIVTETKSSEEENLRLAEEDRKRLERENQELRARADFMENFLEGQIRKYSKEMSELKETLYNNSRE